jgi:hypothetical protein
VADGGDLVDVALVDDGDHRDDANRREVDRWHRLGGVVEDRLGRQCHHESQPFTVAKPA